jgi:hypothetical protein
LALLPLPRLRVLVSLIGKIRNLQHPNPVRHKSLFQVI